MNSYLNFNPTPTPYSYKKSRYKKPKPMPKPAPPPRFDATTLAVGEEGGGYNPPQFDVPTSLAMGEEGGGGYNPPQLDVPTSLAMGEEGGGGYNPPQFDVPTSLAMGEEGGGYNPPQFDVPTSLAMGEEGGGGFCNPKPFPFPFNPEPRMTTFAMGEEGGGYNPPQFEVPTTLAMGEEGGGGYNPPQFDVPTSLAMGEEGGGGYNPPQFDVPTSLAMGEEGGILPPTGLILDDSVSLADAERLHKQADKLDGQTNKKASEKQLIYLEQELSTKLADINKQLASDSISKTLHRQLAAEAKNVTKDLSTLKFMIKNVAVLEGKDLMPSNIKRDFVIDYGNLGLIAGRDGNENQLSQKDIDSFRNTIPR